MRIDLCWNRTIIGAGLVAAGLLGSCGNDNLPKPQKLGPLRVLGLISSNPEINDGTSTPITITPVISDTTGAGSRSIAFSWKVCPDPGVALGISPACTSTLLSSGSGSIAVTDPPLTTAPYSGATTTFGFTLPTNLLSGVAASQASNGVAVLVTYDLTAGSETTSSFRRIIVTSRSTLNTNVSITSIAGLSGAGTPGSGFPASETDLTPSLGSTADSYTVISSTGETLTRTEKLTVSWFTTDGEFEFSRTDGSNSNKWTPPTGGTPRGLAILRDDRGGMSTPFTIGF